MGRTVSTDEGGEGHFVMFKKGDVWFVEFTLEEEPTKIINRPVIVLDASLKLASL